MANPLRDRYWPLGAQDPAVGAFPITPSDSVPFDTNAKGIYVGTTGNITLVTLAGETVTFNSVPAGMVLPVQASQVNATLTTASNLVGLY